MTIKSLVAKQAAIKNISKNPEVCFPAALEGASDWEIPIKFYKHWQRKRKSKESTGFFTSIKLIARAVFPNVPEKQIAAWRKPGSHKQLQEMLDVAREHSIPVIAYINKEHVVGLRPTERNRWLEINQSGSDLKIESRTTKQIFSRLHDTGKKANLVFFDLTRLKSK